MNWRFWAVSLSLVLVASGCAAKPASAHFAVVAPHSQQVGTLQQNGRCWYLSWDDRTWRRVRVKLSHDGFHATVYNQAGDLIAK